MKVKKLFGLMLALMIPVSLSVSIDAQGKEEFKEDFEGAVENVMPADVGIVNEDESLTPNVTVQKESDNNKYLSVGADDFGGEKIMTALYMKKSIETSFKPTVDEDSVYVLEFDCKGSNNSVSKRISLSKNYVELRALIIQEDGAIDYFDTETYVQSGVYFDFDQWNHFSLIYYTKDKEYEIYYNGELIARAKYLPDSLTYLDNFFVFMRKIGKSSEPYSDYLELDNINVYQADTSTKGIEYGSATLWKNTDANPEKIETLEASETITAEVDVKNQSEQPVTVALAAALYKGDVLENVSFASGGISTIPAYSTIKLSTEAMTLPEELTEYKLRFFIWDNFTTIVNIDTVFPIVP